MISILSDFGLEDTYVAAMKAVIYRIAPTEQILDLTHHIPAGDVARGAIELWRVAPVLPTGSVILAVVDPGVGTNRRPIAIQSAEFTCVGPDNGLFTYLIGTEDCEIVELSNPDHLLPVQSATFHGRDIFAPAAAYLVSGRLLSDLGPSLPSFQRLPAPELELAGTHILRGEILYADRFGNLITSIGRLSRAGDIIRLEPWTGNLGAQDLRCPDPVLALPDGVTIPLTNTFGDVGTHSLTAYIGSAGLLEIAVNGGSALECTGLQRGQTVELRTQG
ncbi:MAG: SAM-dependent chlorinase/fluorinase [Anaerolineales bacterium]|nr:SAM-dependent chlorinase/fluorinase [Anaerolineales bacterium]